MNTTLYLNKWLAKFFDLFGDCNYDSKKVSTDWEYANLAFAEHFPDCGKCYDQYKKVVAIIKTCRIGDRVDESRQLTSILDYYMKWILEHSKEHHK